LPTELPALTPYPPAAVVYFKRFRMEADLPGAGDTALPPGFGWLPWVPDLLELHSHALCASFHGEIDTRVFASLGDAEGCRGLMRSIVSRGEFLPQATWLLVCEGDPCGTVQGIRERRGVGAIQNLGIVARYRGNGLGGLLLQKAMRGFHQAGLRRVSLEVTSENDRAVRLYKRLGFRRVKTLYKAVPTHACFFGPRTCAQAHERG